MTGPAAAGRLVTRTRHRLKPDDSRILSRLFVPGQETLIRGQSRAEAVVERILGMPDDEVERTLASTVARFSARYRDLTGTLERNYELIARHLGGQLRPGPSRRRLIGAYFTQEYSLEAAAVCNPSIVPHPDQSGCGPGEARFVMSLRAVGEGHLSSIEFRSGTISAAGVWFDPPGRFPDSGHVRAVRYDRSLFQDKLTELGHDGEASRLLWSTLPRRFDVAALDAALGAVSRQWPGDSHALAEAVHWMAASNYALEFDERSDLSERVLWPVSPAESRGMEDARFVRFTDGGQVTYYATYTAFDGTGVAPHLLATTDFRAFSISQLAGPAARNKGMALFPRRVGGRYAALSRWDRESNAITYSQDARRWGPALKIHAPSRPWELVQLGNCGSPVETPAGWLVFTHGVGPMREYAIGAVLLDLDEPQRLISALPEPLLVAQGAEREGYVPNVLYSCGCLVHGETVVLPYGCSDSSVRIATIDLPRLLDRLAAGRPATIGRPATAGRPRGTGRPARPGRPAEAGDR